MVRIFKNLTKKEVLLGAISLIFIVMQVWLDLKLPDYMSEITMLVQTETGNMSDILSAGGMMLLCALGSLISSVVVAVLASKISANFGANLREKLFDKVQSFSLEEISRFSTASLITRSTNDITQVQTLIVMGLQVMIKAPILAVWAIIKISGKSWQWTFSTGVAVAYLLIIVSICMVLALPKFKKLQVLNDKMNNVTRENLTGLSVVRAYNAEDYQENKFDVVNTELTNTHLFTSRIMAFLMPNIQLVMSGLSLSIYWIGAILIQNADMMNKMTLFSDMVVFSSYAMQVVMAFMMLIIIFIMVPRASVSAKRILEVLETEPTIVDGTINEPQTSAIGNVEFKNVSFKYPDAEEYVIRNVSFSADKGETVAFIGSTGSGKSTLVNLIPRFYEASEGEILVNGINVKDYTQYALHNKIGYVAQKATLFSGTVKSNVAYGENGKAGFLDTDIVEAVYTAQAADFVENLEDGYNGYISQGGSNLSGGQKQRLSIARAIARRPEVFIFDDSFSALDYKTDRKLREALQKDCADATKLIVAQRIGTIKDADRIVVLDNGKVVGIGTHDELMNSCEVYREIAYSQLSKEELA
ncbi:ABC transporter ATP-binding protein [Jeotgalibaca ciconiae]|uniref:ABC transporter ATP-binding protein n=1 Tax=Jeotgalibaca ciconiae TaxID=2496265 RepID=A0A3S9H7M6_9LACT|nr:ABC transporter ATP-binding protein [Jeotgalibaca ciconiae]AZP03348.1 ABC transporter ATP-binding protein [Jeotgalibaca ciconiae]HJB23647.1 ABC transporter ATP-binding protein/permease [Candidatus Jeotgalibaca pullicola]